MHGSRPAAASRPTLGVLAGVLLATGLLAVGCAGPGDRPSDPAVARTPAAVATPVRPPTAVPAEGPSAPEPRAGAEAVGPCTGPGLAVSVGAPARRPDAVSQDLIFQNTGTVACLLRGFPAVSFVAGNEGTRVGEQALPVGGRGGEVRLEPRAAAVVPLRVAATSGYDAATCVPVAVRGLRVAPPGGSGSVFVTRPDTVCSGGPLPAPQMEVRTAVAR